MSAKNSNTPSVPPAASGQSVEDREKLVREHLVTLPEIVRLWRAYTLKTAKQYEDPKDKLRRFLVDLSENLKWGIDREEYDLEHPMGRYNPFLNTALQYLFCEKLDSSNGSSVPDNGHERFRLYMEMQTIKPRGFIKVMLEKEGDWIDEIYLPRVWLPSLEEEWDIWRKKDNVRKKQREAQGRGHDEMGRFIPTRHPLNKTFTKGHPKKFKKVRD